MSARLCCCYSKSVRQRSSREAQRRYPFLSLSVSFSKLHFIVKRYIINWLQHLGSPEPESPHPLGGCHFQAASPHRLYALAVAAAAATISYSATTDWMIASRSVPSGRGTGTACVHRPPPPLPLHSCLCFWQFVDITYSGRRRRERKRF